jgi:hypothetical protein
MTTLRIAWLFARRTSADRATVLLPVIGFAIATVLLIVVVGGAQSFFAGSADPAVGGDGLAFVYQALAVIGLVLLVVPLLTLGGSVARLSARRRDDRLAGLRLLGATPALVAALTVIESTVLAALGVLGGAVLSLPASRLVGLIPFRGVPLGADAYLSAGGIGLCALGVAALAAVSAALSLRGVVVSPLGVRTRQNAPKLHWVRFLVGAFVVGATFVAMSLLRAMEAAVIVVVLGVGFGATIAVLNLVGPLVLRVLALVQARRAKTARRLLAARTVLESPAAAWRQVSGVAMTSFVAVFAGVGVSIMSAASGSSDDPESVTLLTDIRTGIIVVVAISFLMVAASVGVNQAAAVLDRRDLYVSLDRIGMPIEEMDAARSRAVLSPLRVTTVGSALTAAIVVFPLAGMALLTSPLTLALVAACLTGGVLLVWLGLRATRPVLRAVLAETAPSL